MVFAVQNMEKFPKKKERRSLTLKQKTEVLQRLKEKKNNKSELAKEFGVDRATIRKIELQEEQILRKSSSMGGTNCKGKYVSSGKYQKLELALFYWFLKMRDNHETLTSGLILLQARKFASKLNIPSNFKFSKKWLHNFKKRFNIRKLKISGEKLSSDLESIEPFKQQFFEVVDERGLSIDQLYNADESGLFFKILPNYTLVHSKETSATGHKVAKDRITFMPCANASGSNKLPMLMIGKSKKPRAFKNIQLPLQYDASKNAWMTRNIFQSWFHESFVPNVRQYSEKAGIEPKALLLLDNCTAHHFEDELCSDDGRINVIFLPPNVTPILQPMDQHIIQTIKLKYREKLHQEISFSSIDSAVHLKSINLKDVAFWLNEAWMSVSQSVLQQAWRNIGVCVGSKLLHEDDVPLSVLFQQTSR